MEKREQIYKNTKYIKKMEKYFLSVLGKRILQKLLRKK